MFLALSLLHWFLPLLTNPKRVPQVVRRRNLTPRAKPKTLLNPPLALRRLSLLPDLPRKGEYISNIFLYPKPSHQLLVRVYAAMPINPGRLSNQFCTGDTRYTPTLPR